MTIVYQQKKLYPEKKATAALIDTDTQAYCKGFRNWYLHHYQLSRVTRSCDCCYLGNRIWCSSWNSSRSNGWGFRALSTIPIRKMEQVLFIKTSKNEKIKTLAESKLDSISDLVTNVSHEEYQFILKEKGNYRKMKEEIRAKSKKAAYKITAEQREEILK